MLFFPWMSVLIDRTEVLILGWTHGSKAFKHGGEILTGRKGQLVAYLRDRIFGICEEAFGFLDFLAQYVFMGRNPRILCKFYLKPGF